MEYKKLIKTFARDILSCGCEEEVFNHIDHQSRVPIEGGIEADKRINIGNRLLVYIMKVNDIGFTKDNLGKIVTAGKNDRDTGGFNRFRLALIAPESAATTGTLSAIFDVLRDGDEKLHLHIIDPANELAKKLLS